MSAPDRDRDPCAGCSALESRPGLAPWCQRGTEYGQVGCLHKARAPERTAPRPFRRPE